MTRLWPFVACRRPPCVAGNRACRRPFRPPSNRPLTQSQVFLRLRVRRHPAAKPEKLIAYRKRRPERPPAGKIACRTNGQSPESSAARPAWRYFCGFVSFRRCAAKPEKFVRIRGSRPKAGCRQDCLPHSAAKPQDSAESVTLTASSLAEALVISKADSVLLQLSQWAGRAKS